MYKQKKRVLNYLVILFLIILLGVFFVSGADNQNSPNIPKSSNYGVSPDGISKIPDKSQKPEEKKSCKTNEDCGGGTCKEGVCENQESSTPQPSQPIDKSDAPENVKIAAKHLQNTQKEDKNAVSGQSLGTVELTGDGKIIMKDSKGNTVTEVPKDHEIKNNPENPKELNVEKNAPAEKPGEKKEPVVIGDKDKGQDSAQAELENKGKLNHDPEKKEITAEGKGDTKVVLENQEGKKATDPNDQAEKVEVIGGGKIELKKKGEEKPEISISSDKDITYKNTEGEPSVAKKPEEETGNSVEVEKDKIEITAKDGKVKVEDHEKGINIEAEAEENKDGNKKETNVKYDREGEKVTVDGDGKAIVGNGNTEIEVEKRKAKMQRPTPNEDDGESKEDKEKPEDFE
ncbi:MAG: hypothetical protein ABIH37_01925, partial [archaeon]